MLSDRKSGYARANVGHPSSAQEKTAAKNSALVPPSRRLLAIFSRYLHWYIARHFRAMRLANPGRFPNTSGPLIVYANHASWWDPLSFIIISRYFRPKAFHYAPMDAAALKHYGLLRKLGLFAVEVGTPRGAAQFLRAAREILSSPNAVLWVTPEGHFTDMRTRPSVFRPGIAALVTRLEACTLVPLAFEYTFWDERLPEILMSCGHPIEVSDGHLHSAAEWNDQLAAALAATQDELAALSKVRDPALFTSILSGRAGVGGFYDAWKRLRAILSGRAYHGSHGSIRRL